MATVKWIKLFTDIFDNRKIRYLRRQPEGDRLVLIWIMLLTLAGRCNAEGRIFFTEGLPYSAGMLSDELGFEHGTMERALDCFETLGMIRREGDMLQITNWEEYQSTDRLSELREYNREAQRRSRAKRRGLTVTDGSMTSQVCQGTEEEAEEEEEAGEEEEKEELFFEEKKSKKENYGSAGAKSPPVFSPDDELNKMIYAFLEHRKGLKRPIGKQGIYPLLKRLEELGSSPAQQTEILRRSIVNGWAGLFPLPAEPQARPEKGKKRRDVSEVDIEELKKVLDSI